MLIYRITQRKYSDKLFAAGFAGRWNGEGKKVIYSAESIALAFLENMIRRHGAGFNDQFVIMIIEVPDFLKVSTVYLDQLEPGWRGRSYIQC
ncbi:RES family NAD+ phosphorylase [Membranihabitans maritimus]|uniref:RES family NAD+ phosphorylase n=1 Tax=Membranihabitans maritimus TaxID=2904244 RepID=UPI001F200ECE|nr:RES family NAD+ phosphorylase [Membranihabitans maritimus]